MKARPHSCFISSLIVNEAQSYAIKKQLQILPNKNPGIKGRDVVKLCKRIYITSIRYSPNLHFGTIPELTNYVDEVKITNHPKPLL